MYPDDPVHSALFLSAWLLAALTLLPLWRHPHWLVRGLDFPRLQLAALAALLLAGQCLLLDLTAPFAWLAPAITLAERGIPVDWHASLQIGLAMDLLRRDKTASALYLPGDVPAGVESYLAVPALTGTLKTLAAEGPAAF